MLNIIAIGKSRAWADPINKQVTAPTPEHLHFDLRENEPMITDTEENLLLEDVTLINGDRSSDFTTDQLLKIIITEKAEREALKDIGIDSTEVTSRIKASLDNVDKLIKIIDSRVLR